MSSSTELRCTVHTERGWEGVVSSSTERRCMVHMEGGTERVEHPQKLCVQSTGKDGRREGCHPPQN